MKIRRMLSDLPDDLTRPRADRLPPVERSSWDAHGCPACPHPAIEPLEDSSRTLLPAVPAAIDGGALDLAPVDLAPVDLGSADFGPSDLGLDLAREPADLDLDGDLDADGTDFG